MKHKAGTRNDPNHDWFFERFPGPKVWSWWDFAGSFLVFFTLAYLTFFILSKLGVI